MKKIKLNELLENTSQIMNAISQDFVNYYSIDNNESDYLSDLMSEHADNNVDIYYSERAKWFAENWEKVDDAIAEFGKSDNIMQDIASTQYLDNLNELNENLEEIIKCLILNYLIEKGYKEIELEKWEDLQESFDRYSLKYDIERMSEILEIAEEMALCEEME